MIAYFDTSVLLRFVLAQPQTLTEWHQLEAGVTSELTRTECLRVIDRIRVSTTTAEELIERLMRNAETILRRMELVPLQSQVIERAALPLPVALTTLDALHLASAMDYRVSQSANERPLVFATHDRQLAKAARAMHFDVIGVSL